MNMNKRIKVLAVILVLITAFFVAGIIYDDNERLIARTTGIELGEGYEVEKIYKHGFMFRRSSYEAKISVPHDNPQQAVDVITSIYEQDGVFLTYADYYELSSEIFQGERLRPVVENGTNVWTLPVMFDDEENIFFLLVSEDQEHAYLYIFYSRY
jgi:hypothetical protein